MSCYREIWKIIPKLSLLPPLIWSFGYFMAFCVAKVQINHDQLALLWRLQMVILMLKIHRVTRINSSLSVPGRVAQSVGHLTHKSGVLGSIPGLATYFHFSFRFFKKGSCQLLAKVVYEVLVNRLGGLSLPRKSVVRLTDRPDMTLDVYRGRKTTNQQNLLCL